MALLGHRQIKYVKKQEALCNKAVDKKTKTI